jgi:hypothetical protein
MMEATTVLISKVLLMLSVAGVAASLYRWRDARRRDFLLAFILFLVGAAIREVPPIYAGQGPWAHHWILVSGIGRSFKLLGSVLFIRAALNDRYGEYGWIVVVLATAFLAFTT